MVSHAERLSSISPRLVEFKVAAMERWMSELSEESRMILSPVEAHNFVYDWFYAMAEREEGLLPIKVRGRGRMRYIDVLDGGPPLAIWSKSIGVRSHLTRNYPTRTTLAYRRENCLFDCENKPELVILGHTTLQNTTSSVRWIGEIWYTQERVIDEEHREVHHLEHLYSHERGITMIVPSASGHLFVPEASVPEVVKVRVRTARAADAQFEGNSVGIEKALRRRDKKAREQQEDGLGKASSA